MMIIDRREVPVGPGSTILEHHHSGTMTRRVPGLNWLVPEAAVEVPPRDAEPRAILDGGRVRARSRRGCLTAIARLCAGIAPGAAFMSFHFAEAAANVLTHAALHPVATIPEDTVCAVTVEAATAAARGGQDGDRR